tara:strand:- start:2115 stop:2849 length:735 start_codon:yes stop_codon:yes gene_type:complete
MFADVIKAFGYTLKYLTHGVSAAVGTGVHSGASHALGKKKDGLRPDLGILEDISIQSFRSEIADGVDYDGTTGNANTAEKQIRSMSSLYYNQVLPEIDPALVEHAMKVDTKDGYVVSGHADVITEEAVRDLKTGKMLTCHAQLGGYELQRRFHGMKKSKSVIIDSIKRPPKTAPRPKYEKLVYNPELCTILAQQTIGRIKADMDRFCKGKDAGLSRCFQPNTMSVLCGPKYCPAFGTDFCEYGG